MTPAEPRAPMRRSSRNPDEIRPRLASWLASRLAATSAPEVAWLEGTSANGMSSDTLLFDAYWTDAGIAAARRLHRLVARVAPDPADVPVFPSYDLRQQFEVIRRVGERTTVPVPAVLWSESDPSVIGAPFFVMERIDGEVPPDVMPYTFGDNWLYDAPVDRQRHLQDATVRVLAELHAIEDTAGEFSFLAFSGSGGTHLQRHVAHTRAWYEFVVGRGPRSPTIERTFAWLEAHWPDHEGSNGVSWGDARIGNVMYRDFEPVAVLDWEMAGLGPGELDLAWLIYGHCVFQDIAATFELTGMPGFLRPADVAATYEAMTGRAPRDLHWFGTYAAIQWAIVFLRTAQRAIHFGEREAPPDDDIDSVLMNREQLKAMTGGRYWSERSLTQ